MQAGGGRHRLRCELLSERVRVRGFLRGAGGGVGGVLWGSFTSQTKRLKEKLVELEAALAALSREAAQAS